MIEFKNQSPLLAIAIHYSWEMAVNRRDEFFTPEHLLWGIANLPYFSRIMPKKHLIQSLEQYIAQYSPTVPESVQYSECEPSEMLLAIVTQAWIQKESAGRDTLLVTHLINAILSTDKPCKARELLLEEAHGDTVAIMRKACRAFDCNNDGAENSDGSYSGQMVSDEEMPSYGDNDEYAKCISGNTDSDDFQLIGREKEIEAAMRIMMRRDKKNPIFVGDPGVGKSALVRGLISAMKRHDAPESLRNITVYEADFGALLSGAEYKGEFERNLRQMIRRASSRGRVAIFFDDFHRLAGTGRQDNGLNEASLLLKPFFDDPDIYFIATTTFDDYNSLILPNRVISRQFQKIDVVEPSHDECLDILRGIKPRYELFHGVTFADEVLEYAVSASARHIPDRSLPDKAIDLIDETGASIRLGHGPTADTIAATTADISSTLARICSAEALAENPDDSSRLLQLEPTLKREIFGQDHALAQLTEAVLTAKAGLLDANKPMASLLFVGPTGVGKTEAARVLARHLGIPLVRFDMSEYAERHTVAKLIGSPAGYVGYDDGGLLTKAIRKSPNCVLLLDEIEKAHPDIYNILLQVMDYASLTDNKGLKADFHNVIIIMTTNAGARYARKGAAGFVGNNSAGQNMLAAVKQTFNPEFVNRLSDITVFNDMNRAMASLILDKKLSELASKLSVKKVELSLKPEARELLLDEGFSEEYGGREIDRVINARLMPLLVRSILFGELREGGIATVGVEHSSDDKSSRLILIR